MIPRLALIASLLAAAPAWAIAGRAWLEAAINAADVIVLADVESVQSTEGSRIASARVLQTFKGNPGETVRFEASPSWSCDSSWAESGERALLFLVGKPRDKPYFLTSNGTGRLVVKVIAGEQFLETRLLDLPLDVRVQMMREGDGGFTNVVLASLADVFAYVQRGKISSPRPPKLVQYWIFGSVQCDDAGIPLGTTPFTCLDPQNQAWPPGAVRCNDAGIPRSLNNTFRCGTWHDASKLQCEFPNGDHSRGLCGPGVVKDGGMAASQASADLYCDLQSDGSLSCTNHPLLR